MVFQAPWEDLYVFDTFGSDFDTVLYARADCDDYESELACDDDSGGSQSRINVMMDRGDTVYLFVDSFYDSGGRWVLNIDTEGE